MIRKRIEETDAQGRTVTTIIEEPYDAVVEGGNNVGEHDSAVVEEYDEATVYRGHASMMAMLSWWVGLAGIVVSALLALRLSFETGPANRTSLVDFIYHITGPLVRPFQGIANARTLNGGGIFHPETAIAMGAYLGATVLAVVALRMFAAMAANADEAPVVHSSRMVREH